MYVTALSNTQRSAPVGVFDSGVGGLSILAALRRELPQEDFIYFADQAYLPYGDKSKEFILERCLAIAAILQGRGAKLLVVACNTATALAVDEMRMRLSVPVIGIEPAVKPAALASRSGKVGVLATSGTLASERFQGLVKRVAGGADTFLQACPGWVELVERGQADAGEPLLTAALAPLLRKGVDALVLGCTHYRFLVPQIRSLAGESVQIFDSAQGVARQVRRVLEGGTALNPQGGACAYLTSADSERFAQQVTRLLAM